MSHHIPGYRLRLKDHIEHNKETGPAIVDLVYASCPHEIKYKAINASIIVGENGQTLHGLKVIPVAVNILEKYGKHLLKSESERASSWKCVKFSNPIFKNRVDVLKGGRDLMKLLGYTVVEDDGMTYPPDTEPNREKVLDIIADLVLLKKEIELYISQQHPEPGWIRELSNNTSEDISSNLSTQSQGSSNTSSSEKTITPVNHSAENSGNEPNSNILNVSSTRVPIICDICGDQKAKVTCSICDNKLLCDGCDVKWHKHPKRKNHSRQMLTEGPPDTENTQNLEPSKSPPIVTPVQRQQPEMVLTQMTHTGESHMSGLQMPVHTVPKHIVHQQDQMVHGNRLPSGYTMSTSQHFQPQTGSNIRQPPPNLSPLQMQAQFQYQQPNQVYASPQPVSSASPVSQAYAMYQDMYMNRPAVSYQTIPNQQVGMDLLPKLLPDSNISEMAETRVQTAPSQIYNRPNTSPSYAERAFPAESPDMRAGVLGMQHQGLTLSRHPNSESFITYPNRQPSNIISGLSPLEVNKRKSKLELKISTFSEEITEIEHEITMIIHGNEEFYVDPEYITLNKRKGKYMREKRELEKELQNLTDYECNEMKQQLEPKSGFEISNNTIGQIRYPPSLSALFPANQPTYITAEQSNRTPPIFPPSVNQHYNDRINIPYSDINRGNYTNMYPQMQPSSLAVSTKPGTLDNYQTEVTQLKAGFIPESMKPQANLQQQSVTHRQQQLQQQQQVANAAKVVGPLEMFSQSEVIYQPPELTDLKEVNDMEVLNTSDIQEARPSSSTSENDKLKSNREKEQLDLNRFMLEPEPAFHLVGPPSDPPIDNTSLTQQLLSDHRTQQWQCKHCTYINEPGPRICVMCDKTSDHPILMDVTKPLASGVPLNSEQHEQLELFEQRITADQDRIFQEKQQAQRSFEEAERNRLKKEEIEPVVTLKMDEPRDQKLALNSMVPVSTGASDVNEPKAEGIKNKNLIEEKEFNSGSTNNSASSSMYDFGLATSGVPHDPIHNLDLSKALEMINERKRIENMIIDGRDTVNMLKTADKEGIDIDDMSIAIMNGDMENVQPLEWLKERWQNMLESVVTRANLEGREAEENETGQITMKEARRALRSSNGNVNEAVKQCVKNRKELFNFLHAGGPFAREDILKVMHDCQGDDEEAMAQLQMKYLHQFCERMWENSVEGVPQNLLFHPMTPEHCLSVSNSVVNHESFQAIVKNKDTPLERRIRMVMIEGKLQSWGRGETVIKILDWNVGADDDSLECSLEDIVEAVRNCGDRDSSLIYLKQECECCFGNYPMSKMRNFSTCQCKICAGCVKQNFEVAIKDKYIRNWTCPICSQPNIEDEDVAGRYFEFLTLMLQTMLDQEMLELYQTKLRDWHLQKDPNFRWCSHCGNGFLFTGHHLKMTCPQCYLHTCFDCKTMWEDQHENLTCEQFEQWKIDNDPENQAIGLARHLEINGIDCPSCKMKYSLAKGGCMHFRCPQCGHEFCSGCSFPFFQKGMCTKYLACKNKGLHCHHPRDCFFYLRDNEVKDIQKLLQDYNVPFNREPPEGQEDKTHCPVMEQKEHALGKKDEACGRDVEVGQAGVCLNHYKEYLVTLVNKNKVDPVSIMSLDDMKILIQRKEKELPLLKQNEDAKSYKKRLLKYIKTNFPLKKES